MKGLHISRIKNPSVVGQNRILVDKSLLGSTIDRSNSFSTEKSEAIKMNSILKNYSGMAEKYKY
jgi:hypothetical protein